MADFPESDANTKSNELPKKKPEIIILDDTQEYLHGKPGRMHATDQEFDFEPQRVEQPVSLRMVCLFGLVFCIVFSVGLLLITAFALGAAVLLLFQSHSMNQTVFNLWKLYANTIIAMIGFAIGLLSPTFGLSLLMLYFSLKGETVDLQFWKKILRNSYDQN